MNISELFGESVVVYRNLHKKCYSIRVKGHVVHHWGVDPRFCNKYALVLTQVYFHVNKRGRERVLNSGVKNVHAWIRGICLGISYCPQGFVGNRVHYNPFTQTSFHDEFGRPCKDGVTVYVTPKNGIIIKNAELITN